MRFRTRTLAGATMGGIFAIAVMFATAVPATAGASFLGSFHTISTVSSTVPANGDVNPYGVAVVRRSIGRLVRGDVLVSNFNASSNLQGTGTTIVEISPSGRQRLFARIDPDALPGRCPGGVGLDGALEVLRSGWVIVGSLPTTDGMAATAQAGCLIVLSSRGQVRETIAGHGIDGPWGMAARDFGTRAVLFVANTLKGTVAGGGIVVNRGTVLRLWLTVPDEGMPAVASSTVVGSGFGERTDPAALVVGPLGLGLAGNRTLFVADGVGNRIRSIPHALTRMSSAGRGKTLSAAGALNTPLGLTLAPNGDIVTVNAGDGNIVEISRSGVLVATTTLDSSGSPPGAGTCSAWPSCQMGAGCT